MKWVRDTTGRFARRPHYDPDELDTECEALVTTFLQDRHGRIAYPITTDDLTVLIETVTTDLDMYADLAAEEGEVEGVTDFRPGQRPSVRISQRLTHDSRLQNRLRTTLTHELGHVKFHTFLFDAPQSGSLFDAENGPVANTCKRENILEARRTDWMEWQAGFACGALLMPATALRNMIEQFLTASHATTATLPLHSSQGDALLKTVARTYQVSQDAARVRLLQKGVLVESYTSPEKLFQ